jgi:hypothetical protein
VICEFEGEFMKKSLRFSLTEVIPTHFHVFLSCFAILQVLKILRQVMFPFSWKNTRNVFKKSFKASPKTL